MANHHVNDHRFKLLFMDEGDVRDVDGPIRFGCHEMRKLWDADYDTRKLMGLAVPQTDGSWLLWGIEKHEDRSPPDVYRTRSQDGKTFAAPQLVMKGPMDKPYLDKAYFAYNADTGRFLQIRHRRPFENGFLVEAFFSDDGVTWTGCETGPIYTDHDAVSLIWDWRSKEFRTYNTTYQRYKKRIADNKPGKRRVMVVRRSKDGITWDPSGRPFLDEKYLITPNEKDPEGIEFYHCQAFPYADRYIAALLLYQPTMAVVNPNHPNSAHGPQLTVEWIVSPDGLEWQRPYQDIDINACGAKYPDGMIRSNPMIIDGKLLWLSKGEVWGLPEDRIGYVRARSNCEFTSHSFVMPDERLCLNAKAVWPQIHLGRTSGTNGAYIMVQVHDQTGSVIEGFNKERCIFQNVDALDLPLTWGDKDSTSLAGAHVRLRFYARDAHIYAVTT